MVYNKRVANVLQKQIKGEIEHERKNCKDFIEQEEGRHEG
jgi:hypothetical protein